MEKIISDYLKQHLAALKNLEQSQATIKKIAQTCLATLGNKKKIIFMGNGGSAADAQHLTAELVGRFKNNRKSLPALALTTNTSTLTAIGNDYGFDEIFSRQIESLAEPGDLVVGISTSGNSSNVIKAILKAKERGIKTVGFLGQDGGQLQPLVDIALTVSVSQTPLVQEMHICAGHIICDIIETEFAS